MLVISLTPNFGVQSEIVRMKNIFSPDVFLLELDGFARKSKKTKNLAAVKLSLLSQH